MISIIKTVKMTDRPVVSACSLGLLGSSDVSLPSTGLSGVSAVRPLPVASLPVVRERNERPAEASAAAVVKAEQAQAYAFAAAGAGFGSTDQTIHHHTMWAFRGPEPWSDPA
ncbi:hypothetical protein OG233_10010 [Streptomyces sp. NBC_01218]|uniref:hypothetical protein n=1 Tax=unclassified Streptomyces TaxID=2593676 RepID=UPI0023BA3833|nr:MULTISPECIES: hypothetical protein [unclassified Streptomyces]WEH39792.1 hypothetical protein PZB77_09840 [Streptomyces sp. AM 2-1-1]WSQ51483.1 hypothetical protein OG233_10010 [Streptomyces sp. NBC_01218]